VAAHAALGQALEASRAELAAERARATAPPWLTIAIGAAILVLGVGGAAAPLVFILRSPTLDGGLVLSVGLMVIAYGGLVTGILVGVILGMRNARLRLAATPFAEVHATDRLSLSCASCGAGLAASGTEVVAKCAHCGTASLLPAAFLPRQLQRKHAGLVRLRVRTAEARYVAGTTADAINESVGWALIAIGVLSFLLFAVVGASEGFATGIERPMGICCSGGFVLAIFGSFGLMSVRNSRRKRLREPRSG
jgi:hypothetical protein